MTNKPKKTMRETMANIDRLSAIVLSNAAELNAVQNGFVKGTPAPRHPATAKPSQPVSPLAKFTDEYLIQSATHRSAPSADKPEAIAELKTRGISVSDSGIISRSLKGGRAAKISK